MNDRDDDQSGVRFAPRDDTSLRALLRRELQRFLVGRKGLPVDDDLLLELTDEANRIYRDVLRAFMLEDFGWSVRVEDSAVLPGVLVVAALDGRGRKRTLKDLEREIGSRVRGA